MLTRAVTLFACFICAAVLVAASDRSEAPVARKPFDSLPMTLGGWRGERLPPIDSKVLAVLGVDDYVDRAYFTPDGSQVVGLYMGYYGSQRQGDTMHSPLNCIPGAGWEPRSKSTIAVPIPAADPIVINRYVIEKGLDRQLVLYWYQSHGRVVASEYWSKFYLIRDAVRLNRTDGALVRVIAPITPGDESETTAETLATSFVRTLFPQLHDYLPL
jgi:EpsI family protein